MILAKFPNKRRKIGRNLGKSSTKADQVNGFLLQWKLNGITKLSFKMSERKKNGTNAIAWYADERWYYGGCPIKQPIILICELFFSVAFVFVLNVIFFSSFIFFYRVFLAVCVWLLIRLVSSWSCFWLSICLYKCKITIVCAYVPRARALGIGIKRACVRVRARGHTRTSALYPALIQNATWK